MRHCGPASATSIIVWTPSEAMKLRHLLLPVAVVASVAQFANQPAAQSQDVRAAYDRAESLTRRTQGLVVDDIQALNFVPDSTRLWYRKTVKGGHEFVLVDAVARRRGRPSTMRGWPCRSAPRRKGRTWPRRCRSRDSGSSTACRRSNSRSLPTVAAAPPRLAGRAAVLVDPRPTGGARSRTTPARGCLPRPGRISQDKVAVGGGAARGGREGPACRRISRCGSHPTAGGRR